MARGPGHRESARLTPHVLLLLPASEGEAPVLHGDRPHELLWGFHAKAEGTSGDTSHSPRVAHCDVVWDDGDSPFGSDGWASNKLESAQRGINRIKAICYVHVG